MSAYSMWSSKSGLVRVDLEWLASSAAWLANNGVVLRSYATGVELLSSNAGVFYGSSGLYVYFADGVQPSLRGVGCASFVGALSWSG